MIYSVLGNHSDELAIQERLQRLTQWANVSGDSCTPISGSDLGNFNHEGVTLRKKNDFEDFITVKSHWKKKTRLSQNTHHVEIGADFDSSGQVPHYAIPIMSCRKKDSGIEGVGLQNKHFILMTLYKKTNTYIHIKTLGWFTEEKLRYSTQTTIFL